MSNARNNVFDGDTKEFIYFTEAVNQIFATADCTEEVRSYVDFLIGASEGEFEFKASDDEVATRAKSKRDRTQTSARKWVKRKRDDLYKWQVQHGIEFVHCDVGSMISNIKHRSVYRLNILKYAEVVIEEAKNDRSLWAIAPFIAIENAAKQLVQKLQANPTTIIQKKIVKRGTSKSVNTNIHNVMRNLSNLQQIILDGSQITNEDRELFRLMEVGLKNIKRKIEDDEDKGDEQI